MDAGFSLLKFKGRFHCAYIDALVFSLEWEIHEIRKSIARVSLDFKVAVVLYTRLYTAEFNEPLVEVKL